MFEKRGEGRKKRKRGKKEGTGEDEKGGGRELEWGIHFTYSKLYSCFINNPTHNSI